MILDKNTLFSDAQAITATAVSTDFLDLQALGVTPHRGAQLLHNVGHKEIPLLIQVVEAFNTLTSLTVSIESDDNTSFSSAKSVLSETIVLAGLTLGKKSVIRMLPVIKERYVRIKYTVAGTDPTLGKMTAGIVLANDSLGY